MLNVCFARILHTCLPLHLVPKESNKEPSSKRSITPLGTSENWLHVISQGFLCLLLHILWSSFTIFDHHVFLVHLLISASWLRSENHNCPTAGISEQACLSQCLCSNILRQFKQSNYSSLPHDVEWRNIFSVMEHHSAVVVDTNKLNSISSYVKITDKIILDHGQQLAWRSNAAPVFLVRRWWGVNAQG